MFERAVFATDLSSDWDDIIGCAGDIKALGCERVVLAHVLVAKALAGVDGAAGAEARPKLAEQGSQLESQGFSVTVETPAGLPAASLNEVSQSHGASLIVVGSHGKSAWREALLGSFSSALLHHARFPVLLINVQRLMDGGKGGSCQLRASELLRHVLFPTDYSKVAGDIPPFIEHLASRGLSEQNAARGYMDTLVTRFKASGIPRVNGEVVRGHPTLAIVELLQTGDFSLVVMGTQGKSLLSEILLGSVAYNISRLAPCPVLLIPRKSMQ